MTQDDAAKSAPTLGSLCLVYEIDGRHIVVARDEKHTRKLFSDFFGGDTARGHTLRRVSEGERFLITDDYGRKRMMTTDELRRLPPQFIPDGGREMSVMGSLKMKVEVAAGATIDEASIANSDTTDFPKRPCRQCGRMDRPQFEGICNDDSCSHFDKEG